MTPHEAADLASRITQTWRGGPAATVWQEELERLDQGTAGTTYARLRREQEHAPTIAKFIATYRALHTPNRDHEQAQCPVCDSTGWVEAPDLIRGETTYSQVTPCIAPGCPHGAQAQRVLPTIHEANR